MKSIKSKMKQLENHVPSRNTSVEIDAENMGKLYAEHMSNVAIPACECCAKSLKSKVHMFDQGGLYCVGCFAKKPGPAQNYLLFDSSQKYRQNFEIDLFQQLELLGQIQRNGVDSLELILENMGEYIQEESYKRYITSVFCKKYEGLEKIVEEDENSVQVEDYSAQNKEKNYKKQYQNDPQDLLKKNDSNEYKTLDYLMANLHQFSKEEEFDFLIKMKQKQQNQCQSIRKNIQYIMNIPHRKQKLLTFHQIPQPQVEEMRKENVFLEASIRTLIENQEKQQENFRLQLEQLKKIKAREEEKKAKKAQAKELKNSILEKKKRGRKKKVSQKTIQQENSGVKKRGRPRKEESQKSKAQTRVEVKRGRPKKILKEFEVKRGRPKKIRK